MVWGMFVVSVELMLWVLSVWVRLLLWYGIDSVLLNIVMWWSVVLVVEMI